jgi:hypothetical protein
VRRLLTRGLFPQTSLPLRTQDHAVYYVILTILLYSVVLLTPIRWLPGVEPGILTNLIKVFMIGFLSLEGFVILRNESLEIPVTSVVATAVVLAIITLYYRNFTPTLIVLFGISTVFYFQKWPRTVSGLFKAFVIWMTILSAYSIIITYTQLTGFEISGPLHSSYISPTERFGNPNITQNSFGFFGARNIYVLTEMGFVFATVYAWKFKNGLFLICSVVLGTQLLSIINLTGSGRAGLALPAFLFIIILIKTVKLEDVIPLLVVSPLIFWVLVFSIKGSIIQTQYFQSFNQFMSNRPLLYMDSIQVIISDSRSLFGWGPSPWGEYSHFDLTGEQPLHKRMLSRPHNFILGYIIQYGILSGIALMYLCWRVAKVTVQRIRDRDNPTLLAATITMIGSIFVGMAIGGKIGPYAINDAQMIIWWVTFGSTIGMHRS